MGTNSGIKGKIRLAGVEFDWKIENFSSLSKTVDHFYYSPSFNFCGRSWCLKLYPKGETSRQSEDFIGLYVVAKDADPLQKIRYSVGIRAENGETEVWLKGNTVFDKVDGGWGTSKCILTSELLRRKDELIPLNALTLTTTLNTCEEGALKKATKDVSVQTAVEDDLTDDDEDDLTDDDNGDHPQNTGTKDVSVQTAAEDNVEDAKEETSEKTGGEKILQDVRMLWECGDNSDVIIRVRDVEFKAHKTILAARTPVLGAMFRHDTMEKDSGEVTIDDCEPEIFEQILHYIYTGAPRLLTAENASALYVVADKYLVHEVKALCLQCMQDTLCLDTFCNTVELSLMYRERDLLEMTIVFLSKNVIDVMKTVEWQKFLLKHGTRANEILIRALELEARSEKKERADPSHV